MTKESLTFFKILSKKLQIPSVNWEKLNEEKNKTNQILSNQRKQKNKEKNVSTFAQFLSQCF